MFMFHELKFEFGTSYRVTSCIPKPIDRYDYEYEKQKKSKIYWLSKCKKTSKRNNRRVAANG